MFLLFQAEEVFLWLHHPTVGLRDSPPCWCQWNRERMRKWEVQLWQRPFLCTPAWDLVSCLTLRFCHVDRIPVWGWKAVGSSVGCSLCASCFRWTLVLHHTLKCSKRGMESSSNFIIQHSLPSHSAPSTQLVRDSNLLFCSGPSLWGDVSCVNQTWHKISLNPSIMTYARLSE